MKNRTCVLAVAVLTGALVFRLTYAQTRDPMADLPVNLPSDVKKHIEGLLSKDAARQGTSAFALGGMGAEAIPAIPYLIETLNKDQKLKRVGALFLPYGAPHPGIPTTPGAEAEKALSKIGEPAVKPLIDALKSADPGLRHKAANVLRGITGRDFGANPGKWQQWREQNKEGGLPDDAYSRSNETYGQE